MNTNFDLKFGDLFKIIKCYVEPSLQTQYGILKRKSNNQQVTFSNPVVIHAIIIKKKTINDNNHYIDIISGGKSTHTRILLNSFPRTTLEIFETGIRVFRFYGTGNQRFDVVIAVSDF